MRLTLGVELGSNNINQVLQKDNNGVENSDHKIQNVSTPNHYSKKSNVDSIHSEF